jgi:hypothetical protein
MNLLSALDDAPAEERSEEATAGEPKHQDKCTGGNPRYILHATLGSKEGSKVVCLELINRNNNTPRSVQKKKEGITARCEAIRTHTTLNFYPKKNILS